jgi:hypothetical protein
MCFNLSINGVHTKGMLDTGASQVFISTALAKHLHIPTQRTSLQVQIADGKFTSAQATTGNLAVTMAGITIQTKAFVLPALVEGVDTILGESWLRQNLVILDYKAMHCSLPRHNGTRTIIRPVQNTQSTHTLSPCMLAQRQVEVNSSKQANKLLAQGCQSFMLLVRTGHHNLHDVQAATAATAHTGKVNPQQYADSTHDAGDGLIVTGRLHTLMMSL